MLNIPIEFILSTERCNNPFTMWKGSRYGVFLGPNTGKYN